MFVNDSHFHPSLIFEVRLRACYYIAAPKGALNLYDNL
jgi:hypothetical protein